MLGVDDSVGQRSVALGLGGLLGLMLIEENGVRNGDVARTVVPFKWRQIWLLFLGLIKRGNFRRRISLPVVDRDLVELASAF